MAQQVFVRRAKLKDAQTIADFVSRAHPGGSVKRLDVAERFSQVGFMLAESDGATVGLLGWQVENLVIRVTDFLLSPGVDRAATGQAMVQAMEDEGLFLQAEASILFLPRSPSEELLSYWESLGYERRAVANLPRAWREAAAEWHPDAGEVMIKQLRQDLISKPI